MTKELIIRQPIIFFQQEIQFHPQISLKLCYDRQIYRFHDFNWDELCQRWQGRNELKIPWPNCNKVQLQVYYEQECKVGGVLGQGSFNMPMVSAYLDRQIKIALMYDGVYVGSLYCQISNSVESDNQMAKNFLYMHKIEIVILEDITENLTIRVLKNNQQVYYKDFYKTHQIKSLFPNIKIPVKMSDVFTISIQSRNLFIKDVKFLTESIKRGKTSNYEVWLRNKLKNKMGEMKVQYFLQNIFLQNQRQVFARNGIYPHKIEKPIVQVRLINQQEKDKLRRSVIIRCLEEADKRILKINTSMRKLVKKVQVNQNGNKGQQLKEKKQTLNKVSNYQLKDAIKENRTPAFKTSIRN